MYSFLKSAKLNGNEKRLSSLARDLSLSYDEGFNYLYGKRNSFKLFLDKPFNLFGSSMIIAVKKENDLLDLKEIACFIKTYKIIKHCHYKKYHLKLEIKQRLLNPFTKKQRVLELNKFIEEFTQFLLSKGYYDCCQNCGNENSSFALINESKFLFCENCYDIADILVISKTTTFDQTDEKNALGILGALCGSLIGGLFIIAIDQAGFIMSIAGLIMAICTLKGYKLLAGQHSKKGIIAYIIIMVLMTYFSHRFSWSLALAEYYEVSPWMFFSKFNTLLLEGYVNISYYFLDLFTVISFSVLGSIFTIVTVVRNNSFRKIFNI